jgi:1,4-alpha-glucan branching enzyme
MSTDFVLALHTHLPYVLNHGRWPHGSDWITEAAVDTYLPMIEALQAREAEGTPTPVTIGLTPVLANQLAHPTFAAELDLFLAQRLEACEAASADGDGRIADAARFWGQRYARLARVFASIDRDIIGAFRVLAERGRVELMTSAATHGFLPLLGRDESIRLQLAVGRLEFRRLIGTDAAGIWLPECGYRPRGIWRPFPEMRDDRERVGIEEHVHAAGFSFFFADAHMARAGAPLGMHAEPTGGWPERVATSWSPGDPTRTPYRSYRVSPHEHPVHALIRDPRSSAQVWSRHGGYPGDGAYLEFHKTRWPGGLKLWRVSAPGTDLGNKEPYEAGAAFGRAVAHGRHFASLLAEVGEREAHRHPSGDVIVAPFDTELFGHWWFEGPEFLTSVWRSLREQPGVRAVTASRHLADRAGHAGVRLAPGSWGKDGDWSMWIGPETAWMWPPIWRLEEAFWAEARPALANETARPILAQAARSMLLAQSSDWPFIVSTGEVADYAIKRFRGHVEDTEGLLQGIRHGLATGEWEGVQRFAEELRVRDDLFPTILEAIEAALHG